MQKINLKIKKIIKKRAKKKNNEEGKRYWNDIMADI